jgi:hypothetical protein
MSWQNKIKKAEKTAISLDELKEAMDKALSVINTTHFKDKISVEDGDYGYVIMPLIKMLKNLPTLDTGFNDDMDDEWGEG